MGSYLAADDETIAQIAVRFGVNCSELLRLNRGRMSGLTAKAKLIEGTSIVLPDGCSPRASPLAERASKRRRSQSPPLACTPTGAVIFKRLPHSGALTSKKGRQTYRNAGKGTPPTVIPRRLDELEKLEWNGREYSCGRDAREPENKTHLLSSIDCDDQATCVVSEIQVKSASTTPAELAKARLCRAAEPRELICRDEEFKAMSTFFDTNIAARTAASLYVSGKPGTGKTATVTKVLAELRARRPDVKVVEINCMTTSDPRAMYQRILAEVSRGASMYRGLSSAAAEAMLDSKFLLKTKKGAMVALVLDEIDQLETRDKTILYKIFEWAHRENSAVVLLGIANGLDLTERVLPMLKGRGCSPALLNFAPYSKDQFVEIVCRRLAGIPLLDNDKPVLDKAAIDFCAAKVTSASGDLRNCLDICLQTIEITTKNPGARHIPTMMSLFKETYGSSTAQRMKDLPLHQKLVLCSLYRLGVEDREVTVAQLSSMYRNICSEKHVPSVDQGFMEMLMLMACGGFIDVTTTRSKSRVRGRETRLKLRGVAGDISFALGKEPLFADILEK